MDTPCGYQGKLLIAPFGNLDESYTFHLCFEVSYINQYYLRDTNHSVSFNNFN